MFSKFRDLAKSALSSTMLRKVGSYGGISSAIMAAILGITAPTAASAQDAGPRVSTSSTSIGSTNTLNDCAGQRNCVINRADVPGGQGTRGGTVPVWGNEAATPAAGTREADNLTAFRIAMTPFGWQERHIDSDGDGLQEYQRARPENAAVRDCDVNGCIFRITGADGQVRVVRLTRTATNMRFLERNYPTLAAAIAANPNSDVYECALDAQGNVTVTVPGDPVVPSTELPPAYTPPATTEIVTTTETELPGRFGVIGAVDLSVGGSSVKPFDGQMGFVEGQYRAFDNILGGEGTIGTRIIAGNPGGPNPFRIGEIAGTVRLDNLADGALDIRVDAGRLAAGAGASNIPNLSAIRINADNDGIYSGTGARAAVTFRPSDAFSVTGAYARTDRFDELSGNISANINDRVFLSGDAIFTNRDAVQGNPAITADSMVLTGTAQYDWDGQPGGFRVGPRLTYYRENVDITSLPGAGQRTTGFTPGLEASTTFGDGRFAVTGHVSYGSEPNRFRLPVLGETRDRDSGVNFGLTLSMALGGNARASSVAPAYRLDRAAPASPLRPQGETELFVNVVNADGSVTRRIAAGPVDPQAPVGTITSLGVYDQARLQREGVIPTDTNLIINGQAADPNWATRMAGNTDAANQCRATPSVTFNLPTGTVNCTQLNQAYIDAAPAVAADAENPGRARAASIVAFQAQLAAAQTRAANLQGTAGRVAPQRVARPN